MQIVFHGVTASAFGEGFASLLRDPAEVSFLPFDLATEAERHAYATADVIVSFQFKASWPRPEALKLFHVPGAGYDAIELDAMPPSAVVCNCFDHEKAIAEYVMAALLGFEVPLVDADRRLREGDWAYRAGPSEAFHGELAGKTIGLLGFGHIGKAVAARAKAFEMNVHVANRSPVATSSLVDRAFGLDDLPRFWASADYFVVSVPLAPETNGIVDAASFAAMRPSAVVVNVGRGPTIDEQALYEALKGRRIAGAVIDTWYNYPTTAEPNARPSAFPFHELPNVVMTPHMSGWTIGTVRRRQRFMADNIRRRRNGEPCLNVLRPALG